MLIMKDQKLQRVFRVWRPKLAGFMALFVFLPILLTPGLRDGNAANAKSTTPHAKVAKHAKAAKHAKETGKHRIRRHERDRHPRGRNVVVIIADDLGWADVGFRGSDIRTPNIDALAAGGVLLERFYTHALCSPTRAALWTGRFPASFAWDLPSVGEEGPGIAPEAYTLAERFQDAGYATALIGKWHLGPSAESHPNRNGFLHFFGLLGGFIFNVDKITLQDRHDWQENGEDVFGWHYSTTWLGEAASDWIRERDKSRPFFLTLSFNAPHFPQEAPREVVRKYSGIPPCDVFAPPSRCTYMAQVDILDREVGRIIDTLREEKLRDDTLVVFFSDNGGAIVFDGDNGELRGEKLTVYEGGIRVVALMNLPGVIQAGQVSHQQMQVADLFATLEDATGLRIEAPHEDTNMWPSIVANEVEAREPFFFISHDEDLFDGFGFPKSRAVIATINDTGPWKLVEQNYLSPAGSRTLELFHLGLDPYETSNAAPLHPKLVQELYGLLEPLQIE